jgi:hypothetical protein
MFNRTNFADRSSNKLQPLTDEALRQIAPSIFAEQAHESRSARYAYIPTVEVLAAMRREGFYPVQALQSRSRIPGKSDFTKHQIRFNHADAVATAVGDSIAQVCLTNSHDGTSAYALDLGLFRLVCLNGMMVSDGSFQTLKVPHTGKVVERVIEGSFQVIDQTKQIAGRVEEFRALQLSHQEQEIFARNALALRFDTVEGETAPVRPAQVLHARRSADAGNDLWHTFNRVQEHVIRGGMGYLRPARQTEDGRYVSARYMHTREVKGIDQNTSLNRALWRLADEMRALKAAA